jgi:hypothetical protein
MIVWETRNAARQGSIVAASIRVRARIDNTKLCRIRDARKLLLPNPILSEENLNPINNSTERKRVFIAGRRAVPNDDL